MPQQVHHAVQSIQRYHDRSDVDKNKMDSIKNDHAEISGTKVGHVKVEDLVELFSRTV